MRCVLTSSRRFRLGSDPASRCAFTTFDKLGVFVSFALGNRLTGRDQRVDLRCEHPHSPQVVAFLEPLYDPVEMQTPFRRIAEAHGR
jgi:hypothetical protein